MAKRMTDEDRMIAERRLADRIAVTRQAGLIPCNHCGKPVKGERRMIVPLTVQVQLGLASVQNFHPACYLKVGTVAGEDAPCLCGAAGPHADCAVQA